MSVVQDFVAIGSMIAAIGSAIWAAISALAAKRQADFITRKVGMIADPEKMAEVLPTWYIERMATDYWCFGLLLTSGDLVAITRIVGLSDDGAWLEVELADQSEAPAKFAGLSPFTGLPDRPRCSIRVDQIQAAMELTTG